VVAQTATTVTFQWDDRTINEEGYRIRWTGERSGYVDDDGSADLGVNDVDYVLRGFSGFTYCARVYAFNEFGESSPSNEACATLTGGTPGEHTFTVRLNGQGLPGTGNRPYVGKWGRVVGARMTKFRVVDWNLGTLALRFVKPGFTTDDCGNPSRVVEIFDGQTTTPEQMTAIFGAATVPEEAYFVACLAGHTADSWPIIITYIYD
jgi:hypothetical protein